VRKEAAADEQNIVVEAGSVGRGDLEISETHRQQSERKGKNFHRRTNRILHQGLCW